MHEYVGAAHIHSTYSDGTGTIEEIARAASEVGLDFLMLTDHNSLKARKQGNEGWRDGVLVVIGYEINDRADRNHYLAFGLDNTVGTGIPAAEYVRRVAERGGIGFIAHPDECRSSMPEHPAYPWLDWDAEGFTGIEIWNHMSEWMEGLTEENKYQRFLHPLRSIVSPPESTLRRWDELNRSRLVVGIGGVDAHGHKADVMGFFAVEVFPYKVMFKSIHTHVLLDAPLHRNDPAFVEEDARRILEALKSGRAFVANSYHGDPKGFSFVASDGPVLYQQGAEIPFSMSRQLTLHIQLPRQADMRLLRDGVLIHQQRTRDQEWIVKEPGCYRVEAWLDDVAWIFSNPIRVVKNGK